MKHRATWPVMARMLVLSASTLLAAPLIQAQDLISTIRQKPLVLFEAPDDTAPQRTVAPPEGKLPADWLVLGNTPAFYEIQAGAEGKGWVRRSAITMARGSAMPEARCVVSAAPRIVGGVAGASKSCEK